MDLFLSLRNLSAGDEKKVRVIHGRTEKE